MNNDSGGHIIKKRSAGNDPKRRKAAAFDKKTAKRRRTAAIAVTALGAVVCGTFLVLMRMSVPNMRVLFSLSLAFFVLLIVFLVLWTLCAYEKCFRPARIILRCYIICIATGVAFFFTMLGLILSDAHTEEADVGCLIVLGAGLRDDVPSLVLAYRLNAAVNYLRTREGTPVIVAGGVGDGETISEAEAMSRYLMARGVDENSIWKEENSTRTQENIDFSLELMRDKGLDVDNITVAIVTNEFHLYRAKLLADKAGMNTVGVAAPTPSFYLRVLYFSREAFALAAELVFGQKIW